MKDRPPEPGRRSGSPLRRIETGVAASLALAFLALWSLGDEMRAGFELATAIPVGSGGAGTNLVFVIVALILLNSLFISAETAVDALRPAHAKIVRERDPRKAERVQSLLDGRNKITAACALAAQIVRLAIVLCTFLLSPGLLGYLRDSFGWAENHANLLLATLILLVPVALAHLVLSELLPKSFASVNPIRVSSFLYRLIKGTTFVFSVPAGLITSIRTFLISRFGSRPDAETSHLAEEEIKTLAESGHETGEIEVNERELLHSVFEFTDTVAREVMTPRVDMDAMPVRSDPTEVVRVIQDSGHSRIPLFEDTDDQIVGIIHAKDLFGAMLNGKAPNLRSLMRPPLFVPENKSLHELLAEMRQSRSQLAVVQDEFGGTAGIVTIEDIVEELVGDIIDEYDVEEPEVVEAVGGWLVDGKTHVDDLNDAIGSHLASDEFDTIGGYVFGLFGRQPKLGEEISDEGFRFIVAESDGRRILRLKVEPVLTAAEVAAASEEG